MIGYVFQVASRTKAASGQSDLKVNCYGEDSPRGDGFLVGLNASITRNALIQFLVEQCIDNEWCFNSPDQYYIVDINSRSVLMLNNKEFLSYSQTHRVEPLNNWLRHYDKTLPKSSIF